MIPHPTMHWHEIVAAYIDGEFEGRDDLALLRQRVEDWLARHPEAVEDMAEYRQLKEMWQETTPTEPTAAVWDALLQKLPHMPEPRPVRSPWRGIAGRTALLAACLAFVAAVWMLQRPVPVPAPAPVVVEAGDDEVFRVAAAHEVDVLNVDGADTHTLVVGQLPVQDAIRLAEPGEISITSVQPAAHDNTLPEIHVQGPRRPMIWARVDTD